MAPDGPGYLGQRAGGPGALYVEDSRRILKKPGLPRQTRSQRTGFSNVPVPALNPRVKRLNRSFSPRQPGGELVVAADVGQPHVAALEEVRQLFVVQAEELEDGRVDVVDVDAILDGGKPNSS